MVGAGRKEIDFEAAIERDLLDSGGYVQGAPTDFDANRALIAKDLFAFIEASQPSLWEQLKKNHHSNLEEGLLDALEKHLTSQGTLGVLRHGFKFFGKRISAAFFRPAHGLNPDLEAQYAANRLAITRQVKFNPSGEDSVDMMVSLNGLPVATLELKNALTGQTVEHAKKQYRLDRDPNLPLFQYKKRALVHFAVDTDQVYMTTRLSGRKTFFLPFNRGRDGGAGNPTVEGEPYKTAYLWREVLERHSLLDILARFMHLLTEEVQVGAKTVKKEKLIFPRYHQLDVVRRLEAAARDEGPGHHYLVQHSAGSGKSNSIAWSAHRLSSLHDAQDRKVFDSVIVVTDRRVLDRQLQDTIYQFEHKQGVVEKIDQHSGQLAKALEQGTPIVITTLQKFPFVAEKIGSLPNRRYAVIVDEAHSSQSGEAARTLREVLAGSTKDITKADRVADAGVAYGAATDDDAQDPEEPTYEDEIARVMGSRGRQKNLSFFAFTATPKAKTLEVFGRPGPDGKPLPFHLYSMRQAIEEGFILDVLRNYTTYKAYYKLIQKSADSDPDVKKKEATLALARFMSLHPHNIAQKTEVIVEHFRSSIRRKLNGRAKAMVVTRSRLHAVRFKRAFDEYIEERGYQDLKALVAFSGTVYDPDGGEYTEPGMNDGLPEAQLRAEFAKDEFQVLLVANKYQTGFDQPLLVAMYVDKKLSGVQAVQTLSRLNRSHPGKTDTFVLDFVNEADEIRAAFQPFYEQTTVSEQADPDQFIQLQHELDEARVWTDAELESFAKVFYRPKQNLTDREHEEIHRYLQPAEDRYAAWEDEDARAEWKSKLQAFVRLYSFLSQVMPYTDRELEVRYSFGRLLLKRLPRSERERVELDGEVDLHSYRLARIGETDIVLDKAGTGEVRGPTAVGTRQATDDEVPLHEVIEIINERFGTEFTTSDQLVVDQVVLDGKADEQVKARAKANSFENFNISIKDKIEGLMIDRMERNTALVTKFLNEDELRKLLSEHIARRIYEDLKDTG
ncbi:MAG: type I restriction endonuclease subunit R [Sandaracinaceae bacterium]